MATATKKPTALDELAQLDAELVDARHRARLAELDTQEAKRDVERISARLVEAHAEDDRDQVAQLRDHRRHAEDVLREAEEVAAGRVLAVRRAEANRSRYAHEHLDALIRGITPDAENAATQVDEAMLALSAAVGDWHAQQQRVLELVHLGSDDPTIARSIPSLPQDLTDAAREVQRTRRGPVPVPLPRR